MSPYLNETLSPQTFRAVTPSDTVILGNGKFLRVGVAGNLALKGVEDSAAVTLAVADKEYVPFGGGYVMSTNTTATGIVLFG